MSGSETAGSMSKRFSTLKATAAGILGVATAAYCGLAALLYVGQREILYHPTQLVPEPAAYGVPRMTAERVPAGKNVRPLIWWAPPAKSSHPVIVYFHGNAGHLGHRAARARRYLEEGYGLLLAGYRYNAGAGGEPSEEGLLADGRAAIEFAKDRGHAPEKMVFYGESLGTGVAVALAAEYRPAALVLESAYSSIADVAQEVYWYLPVRWMVKDNFDSAARIQRVKSPVLLIHGEGDPVTPAWSARKLFELSPGPKEAHFLKGGGHHNLYPLGADRLVLDFLGRHALVRQRAAANPGGGSPKPSQFP